MAMIEAYQPDLYADRVEQRTFDEAVFRMAKLYQYGERRRTLEDFATLLVDHKDEEGNPIPDTMFDRQRGDEVVRCDNEVYLGIDTEGIVALRTDDSGYHRLVMQISPEGQWVEPMVFDGSSRNEFGFRVDIATTDNSRPWSPKAAEYGPSPVEDRDSIYVQELNGVRNAWRHNGITKTDTPLLPLAEVRRAVLELDAHPQPEAKVYRIDDYRKSDQ